MKSRRNRSDAAESAGERDLQEKIDAFCLMDDKFMRKCLEKSRACVQYIARALLDDDSLVVREFSTQRTVANLQGRSATLDIYAVDGRNHEIDIEIQNNLPDADVRRARWYSALLDANNLRAGDDPRRLRETYVIFITRGDYFALGEECMKFVRTDDKTGTKLGDGTTIIYVDGESRSDTRIGRLVHDLRCSNPDEMHSKTLANQVRRFKTTKEGRKAMSEVLERMCAEERMAGKREGKREGKIEGLLAAAKRMVQSGLATLDQVVTTLKLDKAQARALRAML